MQAGTYVDPATYYEAAAESWATHFGCKFNGTLSFMLLQARFRMPQETMDDIECDLDAFAARVDDYLYGMV